MQLPEDVKMVLPGDDATLTVELNTKVPMHEGLRWVVYAEQYYTVLTDSFNR